MLRAAAVAAGVARDANGSAALLATFTAAALRDTSPFPACKYETDILYNKHVCHAASEHEVDAASRAGNSASPHNSHQAPISHHLPNSHPGTSSSQSLPSTSGREASWLASTAARPLAAEGGISAHRSFSSTTGPPAPSIPHNARCDDFSEPANGSERAECVVIGAGVVGLAIARALAQAGKEVLILEAESAVGTQTSSRHSEVIHAGLYYPRGSLKAKLCVRGAKLLYDYCRQAATDFLLCSV